jgi:hypothetical protein
MRATQNRVGAADGEKIARIAAPLVVGAQHGDQLAQIKSARTAKFFDQSLVFSPRTTM